MVEERVEFVKKEKFWAVDVASKTATLVWYNWDIFISGQGLDLL